MAKKLSFKHKALAELKKTHRKYRQHIEIITYEEVTWMLLGILMGILAAKGLYLLLLFIPAMLIIVFIWAKTHEKKFGLKNVFGEKYKNP